MKNTLLPTSIKPFYLLALLLFIFSLAGCMPQHLKYTQKSALSGDSEAMYDMARNYAHDNRGPKRIDMDHEKARYWLMKSVKAKNDFAIRKVMELTKSDFLSSNYGISKSIASKILEKMLPEYVNSQSITAEIHKTLSLYYGDYNIKNYKKAIEHEVGYLKTRTYGKKHTIDSRITKEIAKKYPDYYVNEFLPAFSRRNVEVKYPYLNFHADLFRDKPQYHQKIIASLEKESNRYDNWSVEKMGMIASCLDDIPYDSSYEKSYTSILKNIERYYSGYGSYAYSSSNLLNKAAQRYEANQEYKEAYDLYAKLQNAKKMQELSKKIASTNKGYIATDKKQWCESYRKDFQWLYKKADRITDVCNYDRKNLEAQLKSVNDEFSKRCQRNCSNNYKYQQRKYADKLKYYSKCIKNKSIPSQIFQLQAKAKQDLGEASIRQCFNKREQPDMENHIKKIFSQVEKDYRQLEDTIKSYENINKKLETQINRIAREEQRKKQEESDRRRREFYADLQRTISSAGNQIIQTSRATNQAIYSGYSALDQKKMQNGSSKGTQRSSKEYTFKYKAPVDETKLSKKSKKTKKQKTTVYECMESAGLRSNKSLAIKASNQKARTCAERKCVNNGGNFINSSVTIHPEYCTERKKGSDSWEYDCKGHVSVKCTQ